MRIELIKALGLSIVLIMATLSLRPASEVLFRENTHILAQYEAYDDNLE